MRGWIGFPLWPGFWIALPVPVRWLLLALAALLLLVLAFTVLGAGLLILDGNGAVPDFGPTENQVPSRAPAHPWKQTW